MIQKPNLDVEGMDDFHRYVTDPNNASNHIHNAANALQNVRPLRKHYRTAVDHKFATMEHQNRINTLQGIAKELTAIADHVQSKLSNH